MKSSEASKVLISREDTWGESAGLRERERERPGHSPACMLTFYRDGFQCEGLREVCRHFMGERPFPWGSFLSMHSLGGLLDPKNEQYVASLSLTWAGLNPSLFCHSFDLEVPTGDTVQLLILFLLLSLSQSINSGRCLTWGLSPSSRGLSHPPKPRGVPRWLDPWFSLCLFADTVDMVSLERAQSPSVLPERRGDGTDTKRGLLKRWWRCCCQCEGMKEPGKSDGIEKPGRGKAGTV